MQKYKNAKIQKNDRFCKALNWITCTSINSTLVGVVRTNTGSFRKNVKSKMFLKTSIFTKNCFLSCFRSEISDKFMPYSIQVHDDHPEASSEAEAALNVLSVYGRLFEAKH